MADFDSVVIGAGIIGLATAAALAKAGHSVLVLEQEKQIGLHTSSRNSEVIHAGIYYRADSLKARFCNEGRGKLYKYCEDYNVPYKKIGKLIVASSQSEIAKLHNIYELAQHNGAAPLEWLTKNKIARLEPSLSCEAALLSPETGIIDSHMFMISLLGQIEMNGGELALNSTLKDIRTSPDGYTLFVDTGDSDLFQITTTSLINSAGLYAWDVAKSIYEVADMVLPQRYLAKGTYFSYSRKAPFSHLIYPVPQEGGLGVHVTLDMAGGMRFGPDVEWVDNVDYSPNSTRKDDFIAAIKNYFPAIDADALFPAFAGIRPKVTPPGVENDFMIETVQSDIGGPSIHLFGIESPGLTSSLAIADHVRDHLMLTL